MKRLQDLLDKPLIKSMVRAADALRDARRWDEAVSAYQRIVSRRRRHAGAWVQLGHCLSKLGRFDEALGAYREADRHRPDHADTLFHLASMLFRLNRGSEAEPLFERVVALEPSGTDLSRAARLAAPHDSATPEWLDHVVIGTTGTCNASCIHCPTGKASTAHVPRMPMPMPLFRRIIDEIAESGMDVAGQLAFGLFGDGLVDPFVVERARYVRNRLPGIRLNVNTNGAAYNPARHAELDRYVTTLSLHCESLDSATYDRLMQPLRLARVREKYPLIFRDFPGKVAVSAPLSRLNADERPALMDYFYGLGAADVNFPPMSNRLHNDVALFERLAFAPVPIACSPSILYNLIVDCDGTVLACCNDFARAEPVGDLGSQSLGEMLAGRQRMAFRDKLARGCHSEVATCSRCEGDVPVSIPPIGQKVERAA